MPLYKIRNINTGEEMFTYWSKEDKERLEQKSEDGLIFVQDEAGNKWLFCEPNFTFNNQMRDRGVKGKNKWI